MWMVAPSSPSGAVASSRLHTETQGCASASATSGSEHSKTATEVNASSSMSKSKMVSIASYSTTSDVGMFSPAEKKFRL